MDWNSETLNFLSQCFHNTLSPLAEPRRRAEAALAEAAARPNYGVAVLRLVADPAVDDQIRQSAAINFKNHLKTNWHQQQNDSEKEQIKSLIVPLTINSSPKIQAQLNEALTIIGKHDFPKAWPNLLPELVRGLDNLSQASDYASVNGVLATVNSLFMKFRGPCDMKDLMYCVDNFGEPLLKVFKRTAVFMEQTVASGNSTNTIVFRDYIASQMWCFRIFYSLNFWCLPDINYMDEWMVEFKKYLMVKYASLEDSGKEGLALVDELRFAVCETVSLYIRRGEDAFVKYLSGFVDVVSGLLAVISNSSSRERLTMTAFRFLTAVSKRHHKQFARDDILEHIIRSVVIPNVMLREDDEELFEMNYVEFIRRDMEGSDIDTRRRMACELVKRIAMNYKKEVNEKMRAQLQILLASFAENPSANWRHKECAIYLVATKIIEIEGFFKIVIVPELKNQEVDRFPMLKAGALKFFSVFTNQISKPVALGLLPDVVRLLVHESNVVHSYAAICIEQLLLVKDKGGRRGRYLAVDITPFLLPLMNNLFSALHKPESEENQYVMKCIMRVLGVANVTQEFALPCINGLAAVLNRVCENPKNPDFNYYMFESISALIGRACKNDPLLVKPFETSLFPSLQMILARDVSEFFPYAFQLLAQFVDLSQPPLPGNYTDIFVVILLPESWQRPGNVQPLARLLQAFLKKAKHELNQQGILSSVVGIFNRLVSAPSTEEEGFYVVNTVIENLGYDVISPYLSHIWGALFNRLQNNRTVKFVKNLVKHMSLFVVKHGCNNLASSMNNVQPDVFRAILEQLWIPNLNLITGKMEIKLASVASTRLLCELLSQSESKLWGKMLDSIVTLVTRLENRVEEDLEILDFGGNVGYNAKYVRLINAGRKEKDPLREINDLKQFLVASLADLSARSRGVYPQIINEHLEPANQAALFELCRAYKLSIV